MSFPKIPFRAALLATGLIAGCGLGATAIAADDEPVPTAHSDGLGATLGDTAITAKVKAKFLGESTLKDSDISVTTTNGVVTLTGSASNADARKHAGELASKVAGVSSVDNSLVTPSASKTEAKAKQAVATTKTAVSDSWITTKVKSELLADSISKGFEVNVDTVNGVVVLKGTLANPDAVAHAKDIAAKIEGVKGVDISALGVSSK